jgi:pilus assembly protein CpaB
MKPKTLILMVIAIVCGLGASYMTSRLLAERGSGDQDVEKVTVLVAKRHLDMATAFKNPKDLLESQEFLKGKEPKNAVTSYDQVKSKFLKRPLRKGDFLTPEDLSDDVAVIPLAPGMRAVGLRVNSEAIAGGFASLPGSRVDIISTVRRPSDDDSHSRVLLENVLVLAADQMKDRPDGAVLASVVTVALNPEDTLRVTLAKDLGPLTLVLRNPLDTSHAEKDRINITQVLRSPHDKVDTNEGKGGPGFEEPTAGSGVAAVPTIPGAGTKGAKAVAKAGPAPLKEDPVVRKHVVTVVEGDHTRKVVFVLSDNGEVSQEEVTEVGASSSADTGSGAAPTAPPGPSPIRPGVPVTVPQPVVVPPTLPRNPVPRPGLGLGGLR